MSERSEFLRFPSWQLLRREPAQRAQGPGSPFFAYLLWRSKESERLPGRTRLDRPKKKTKRSTEERTRSEKFKQEQTAMLRDQFRKC
jgi:hypothetical protein